ncbi:TonB C-terminal domain-containing protein [Candidatus Babeliales bacterium]|nr:TonB C-terminal domain-containing protein [Candidatus Babeliales bacterium]
MLRWPRKNVPKRYQFLAKLFLVSCALHVMAVLVLCFFYRSGTVYTIDLNRRSAQVVFLPFHKSTTTRLSGGSQPGGAAPVQNVRQKPHKQKPATTLVAKVIKPAQKTPQKKKVSQTAQKSVSQQKKVALVPPQQKVDNTAKVSPAATQKKQEMPIVPRKESVSSVAEPVVASSVLPTDVPVGDDVIYVGVQELDMLELHDSIRNEIERVWHPPVGIASGRSCEVKLRVAWNGSVDTVEVIEGSGIIAFDASVRHAVLKMQFPKGAHGKTLCIPFVQ